MKKILWLLLVVISMGVEAQNMVVVQDGKTVNLIEEHKKANAKIGVMEGFRVQIFFDSGANSKVNAESEKNKFSIIYPKVATYLTFKEPNFKLRVGDFRTRNEARGFLKEIMVNYPNAFVIKDEIEFPPLATEDPNIENQ